MQKTNNIIIKTALAIIAAVLTTGCIFEKMDMPEDLQSVLIQVNVSADEMMTKSEAPTAAEKKINTIRIYAFRNGQLSGHYFSNSITPGMPIMMDLKLPETGTADLDFYAIVNEESMTRTSGTSALSESTAEADLAAFTFSALGASDGSLPMYGTTDVTIDMTNVSENKNTASGHTDHYYITENANSESIFTVALNLFRPVAKVSFYVATPNGASDGVFITDLTMLPKGTRQYGYLLPPSAEALRNIPTGIGVDYVTSPVAVTGVEAAYMPVFENEYVFEVPFGSDQWFTPVNTNSVVYELYYTGGEGAVNMPPIVRNTHYKVYCTLPPGEGQIEVSYVVADWEGDHEWELNFDHPTYQNPVQKTGDYSNTGGAATMYYTGTEEGAFSVDFQMTAPTGQTWTPTFFGNISDCAIKVYERGTLTEVSTPVTASDKWYTIKIIPLKAGNIGGVVQFGISYIPTWSTDPEFLQINGSAGSLVWTTAGSSADLIVVEQIEK